MYYYIVHLRTFQFNFCKLKYGHLSIEYTLHMDGVQIRSTNGKNLKCKMCCVADRQTIQHIIDTRIWTTELSSRTSWWQIIWYVFTYFGSMIMYINNTKASTHQYRNKEKEKTGQNWTLPWITFNHRTRKN